MKIEKVATQYAIEVDLLGILNSDLEKENKDLWDDKLFFQLADIRGVEEVEYNGHFGNFVWVTVRTEHDIKETWDQIKKFINDAMGGE